MPVKSIGTDHSVHGAEGDERIRTAARFGTNECFYDALSEREKGEGGAGEARRRTGTGWRQVAETPEADTQIRVDRRGADSSSPSFSLSTSRAGGGS